MSDGGRSMRAVVAMFLLVLANGGAAFAAPKCPLESVIKHVEVNGDDSTLPANFAESLGFPNAVLKVKRLAFKQESTNTFRSVDIVLGNRDRVLFIRRDDTIIFWRVSPSGQILMTTVAGPDRLERRNNPIHAADYAAVQDYFCDLFDLAKNEKASPGR